MTIVAWGGVGKTLLVREWMNRLAADGWRGARPHGRHRRDRQSRAHRHSRPHAARPYGDEVFCFVVCVDQHVVTARDALEDVWFIDLPESPRS